MTVPPVPGTMVPKAKSLRTLRPIGLAIDAVAVPWAACASFPDASNKAASPMMYKNFLCKLKPDYHLFFRDTTPKEIAFAKQEEFS